MPGKPFDPRAEAHELLRGAQCGHPHEPHSPACDDETQALLRAYRLGLWRAAEVATALGHHAAAREINKEMRKGMSN
jgi:hypothetical protein